MFSSAKKYLKIATDYLGYTYTKLNDKYEAVNIVVDETIHHTQIVKLAKIQCDIYQSVHGEELTIANIRKWSSDHKEHIINAFKLHNAIMGRNEEDIANITKNVESKDAIRMNFILELLCDSVPSFLEDVFTDAELNTKIDKCVPKEADLTQYKSTGVSILKELPTRSTISHKMPREEASAKVAELSQGTTGKEWREQLKKQKRGGKSKKQKQKKTGKQRKTARKQ